MLRVEKVSFLLLLLLFLSSAATSVSAGDEEQFEQRQTGVVEGFLTGLIDSAIEPGIPPTKKNRLLKTASSLVTATTSRETVRVMGTKIKRPLTK